MTKKRNSLSIILVVIIALSFIIVIYFITRPANFYQPVSYNQPTATNIQSSSQIYRSGNLKFTISVPSGFQVEDAEITLTLSDTNGRQIDVIRNGTQFKNLFEYIADFDKRRNLASSEINRISIDGKEAMSRIVIFSEENVKQKSYYIYVDNWVYIISTSSETLFDDLDTVAQSFRYTQ